MRGIAALILTAIIAAAFAGAAHGDTGFYRVLAAKPNAEYEDAVRAFHELATGRSAGDNATFASLAGELVSRKIARPEWTSDPKARLTRGRAAYLLCQALHIKGGVTMSVFGPSERYCFRECLYLGVWPGGNQRDLMTGGELMGVLKWAADYQEEHEKKPPAEAPPPKP